MVESVGFHKFHEGKTRKDALVKLRELLKHHKDKVNETDGSGHTGLMGAALHCNYKAVKLLLENGANKSILDDDGHDVFWHLQIVKNWGVFFLGRGNIVVCLYLGMAHSLNRVRIRRLLRK